MKSIGSAKGGPVKRPLRIRRTYFVHKSPYYSANATRFRTEGFGYEYLQARSRNPSMRWIDFVAATTLSLAPRTNSTGTQHGETESSIFF